ncbi:MAG: site-2 protease family protein [Crocinitomicaceae bacterium]|nr:site-2 protease family protein [Crocinitomicaceae bacterium]
MDEFDLYPPKPDLIERKQKGGLSLTIFSLVLFIMAFLLLVGDEVIFVADLVMVLLIHELGHFVMMKIFKYENVRMLFVPLMGAFVQGKKKRYSQKEGFLVTMAGPFPGIVVGAILLWYSCFDQLHWMALLGAMFLILNIINLLPLDPLDGGQMFKLLVRKKHELFLMVFAFISSIAVIAIGWFASLYIVMAFGFFMGFRVRALQKRFQVHKNLAEEEINYSTTYKLLSNKDFVRIKEVLIQHTPALQKYLDQVSSDEADPVIASQVNNILDAPLKNDASAFFKLIVILLWIAAFLLPVYFFYVLDITWALPN